MMLFTVFIFGVAQGFLSMKAVMNCETWLEGLTTWLLGMATMVAWYEIGKAYAMSTR